MWKKIESLFQSIVSWNVTKVLLLKFTIYLTCIKVAYLLDQWFLTFISLPNPYVILHDFVEPQFFHLFNYKPTTFNHNTNKYITVSMCFLLFFSGDQLRNSWLCFRNSNSQVIFTCKPVLLLRFDFHQSRKRTLA